jgi:hypothetical protein
MNPTYARILDLTPSFDYGMEALVRLLDVEESTDIPTACIPLGGSPRILLNPAFVAAHCQTDEALVTLVLHEIHHLLLGHTRLYRRVTTADNIAFDALINAMLSRRRPEPAWTALFCSTYAADRFPECLLRPPEGFPGEPRFAPEVDAPTRAALRDLYYQNAGTYHDVWELLRQDGRLGGDTPALLGHHDGDHRGLQATDNPALFEAVRQIVDTWPPPPDPRIGRSLADIDLVRTVPPRPHPAGVIRRAILDAARKGALHAGQPDTSHDPAQVAWPTRDRRAFALAAHGSPALLQATTLPGRPRPRGLTPVDIYVDTSGSMSAVLPWLLGAVVSCRGLVQPTVWTFNDRVQPTTLDTLARGELRGGCGTNGSSVSAHIHEKMSSAAVMLTDGYVGPIPLAHLPACRAARLQVVLTPGGHRADLATAAAAFHTLELP